MKMKRTRQKLRLAHEIDSITDKKFSMCYRHRQTYGCTRKREGHIIIAILQKSGGLVYSVAHVIIFSYSDNP